MHFLEHGSFSFAGNVHGTGRNDVPLLLEALRSQGATHRVSVPDDPDGDGLKDAEEKHFGTNPSLKDTDGDGVPDGFGLAHALGQAVSALPRTPAPTPYVVEHPATDLMPCGVCGSNLNAGWFEVVNRKENLAVRVPGLALHFLRHGSFAWSPQDRSAPTTWVCTSRMSWVPLFIRSTLLTRARARMRAPAGTGEGKRRRSEP